MSAITETEIFGSFLPFPTIKSITLETGGKEVKEKNPHIDESTMADGSANPFGDPKFVEKSGKLKISVNAVVKDNLSFSESQFGSQWMSSDASKFVNVAIVQSTNAQLTDLMLKNADLGAAMGFPYGSAPWSKVISDKKGFVTGQKYKMTQNGQILINSLSSISEGTEDKVVKFETYVNNHGDTVIEYPINFTFSVDEENPSHLAYFCIATLDFDLLATEFDVNPEDITDSVSSLREISEMSHIVAIDGGNNVSIQNKFFLKDGTPFNGPVHYHPENGWMAGAQHSDQPHSLLDLKKIANTVVRDFRSAVQEDIDLSALYDAESEINKLINNLSTTSYRSKEQKKKSYLYDCLSYSEPRGFANGVTGQCGILFSLDMHSIVKDNSTFPGLYKIDSNNLKSEFTTKSKIRELKLFQRQIRKSNNTNELGVKNHVSKPIHADKPPTQIGSFSDYGSKVNITEQEIYFPDMPFASAFDHIRTFTSKNVLYGGEHEYFIELEIEDGTIKYFANKIEKLYELLDELKIYYNDATKLSTFYNNNGQAYQKSNFNIYLNKFTEEWINKKKNEVQNPGTYKSIEKSINNNLIKVYKILANLGGQTATFKAKVLNIIKPETGSPAGISKIIKLVEHTITKMNGLAGISSYNISNNGIGAKGSNQDVTDKKGLQNKSKSQRSTFKVIIPLNSKVDPGGNLDVGYDYISERADVIKAPQARHWPETGLKIIDSETFLGRVSDESAKYYDSSDFDQDVSNNRTIGDTLGNTALSHLTPSRVRVGHQFENIILSGLAGGFISTAVKANFRKIMLKSIKYNLDDRNLLPTAKENDEIQDAMLKESDNKDLLMELFSSPGVQITPTSDSSLFESLVGFINDDDVSDDKKNNLEEEIGTLLKEEYNGRNLTPRKNPNSLFFNLLAVMSDDIKHKKPLEYYDFSKLVPKPGTSGGPPSTLASVDYSLMKSEEHIYDKILESYSGIPGNFLQKLPNQLKSLIKESDPNSLTGTKGTGLFNAGTKDPKIYLHDYAPYWFHFENIVQIQYLAGYEQNNYSTYINMPIWKTLDLDSFNDFPKSKILCRVQKYENKLLDIQRPELLELPIYNEYFILNLEE